jgi:hypothetical protein
MKHNKTKNFLHLIFFSIVLISTSCTKDKTSIESMTESNAIQSVKNIVGQKGDVNIIHTPTSTNIKTMEINNDSVKVLSLSEFQKVFNDLNVDSNSSIPILVDSPKQFSKQPGSNKANAFVDVDGPKPAGLYRYSFQPQENGNSSYFSNMNISYNLDANGRIIGTPSIYFTGINLFSWQAAQSSLISFNSNTLSSSFAITGSTTFGIQVGGFNLGWSSTITFYITINSDDQAETPIIVSSKS